MKSSIYMSGDCNWEYVESDRVTQYNSGIINNEDGWTERESQYGEKTFLSLRSVLCVVRCTYVGSVCMQCRKGVRFLQIWSCPMCHMGYDQICKNLTWHVTDDLRMWEVDIKYVTFTYI